MYDGVTRDSALDIPGDTGEDLGSISGPTHFVVSFKGPSSDWYTM